MDLLFRRNRCRQLMPVSLAPGRDGMGTHGGSLSYGNLPVQYGMYLEVFLFGFQTFKLLDVTRYTVAGTW